MSELQRRFDEQLAKLNPQQRQAVDALEGPVMVFAGPGTGKTQVLTLRIANLIAQGLAEPEQILALTFTNAAAANMRARLASLIGPAALKVNFHTFHDFCQEIIAREPEAFPFRENATPLGDLERIALLEEIIDQTELVALRPAGKKYYYLEAITRALEQLKSEAVTPEAYQELVAREEVRLGELIEAEMAKKRPSKSKISDWEKALARQRELIPIYRTYGQRLAERARYDFADMILQTVAVFQGHPEILSIYQEKFQYVLVDEYQDTNNAQDQVLDLLVAYWGEQANIFVVGDPFQSIYRFQGANLENFLGFGQRYPAAQVINLQTGYRCHNRTYALAHALTGAMTPLAEAWQPAGALQNCQARAGEPALLTECASQESEIINIFARIKQLLAAGAAPEQIAIIYRNNADAPALARVAAAQEIPFEIEGGSDILETEIIGQVLDCLAFLVALADEKADEAALYRLLWLPAADLDELAIVSLSRHCREARRSLIFPFFDPDDKIWPQVLADGIKQAEIDKIRSFGQKFRKLAKMSQNIKPTELLQNLLEESGILRWVRAQPEHVTLVLTLYTFQARVADWQARTAGFDLAGLLDNVERMRAHHLRLPLQDLDVRRGAIALTTAHKAKGREWDYVFIYGLNRGTWDGRRAQVAITLPAGIIRQQQLDEKTASADEEKRLFYVALTRARRGNFISWHLSETSEGATRTRQPADLAYWLQEQVAAGLAANAPELLDSAAVNEQIAAFLGAPPARDWSAATRTYLREQVQHLTLSATMLNDYLADVNTFVERHLLRAPQWRASVSLYFGNAMHRALERALRPAVGGGEESGGDGQNSPLSLSEAQAVFCADFDRQDIDEPDRSTWRRLGEASLAVYYQAAGLASVHPLAVEQQLGTLPALLLDDIPLTGKIDRIDRQPDGSLQVIDYKTSSPQTINQLLGKTASSKLSERERALPESIRSPYKRQLLFYKLLCERAGIWREPVTSGAIHFVKAEKDKITIRQLPLTDAELADLEALIHDVWREIQTLAFLEHTAAG